MTNPIHATDHITIHPTRIELADFLHPEAALANKPFVNRARIDAVLTELHAIYDAVSEDTERGAAVLGNQRRAIRAAYNTLRSEGSVNERGLPARPELRDPARTPVRFTATVRVSGIFANVREMTITTEVMRTQRTHEPAIRRAIEGEVEYQLRQEDLDETPWQIDGYTADVPLD